MNKVYCINCKHLTKTYECAHPNNTKLSSSWYNSKIVVVNSEMTKPHMKNLHNTCDLFKQKSTWQSLKDWVARSLV